MTEFQKACHALDLAAFGVVGSATALRSAGLFDASSFDRLRECLDQFETAQRRVEATKPEVA